ncbi:MAG: ferritin family protein [Desulfosporosinus sp.]|nr:ferritin family protein [Desulfosporosinus sp.]
MSYFTEIIQFAFDREIEAETFYLEIAAKTTKEAMRGIFVGFASEEKRHQQILKGILNSKETLLQFKPVSDYKISETVEVPGLLDDMTMKDAFSIAMKKEEEAMKMYQKLASDAPAEEFKKLFESLALMEQGHKVKMEKYYSDVAYNEVW